MNTGRGPWVPLLQKCQDISAHRLVWREQTGTVTTFGGGVLSMAWALLPPRQPSPQTQDDPTELCSGVLWPGGGHIARMGNGRGAQAAGRGRHFSRLLGSFSAGPGLGRGVHARPPRAHPSGPCNRSESPEWPPPSLAPDSPGHPGPAQVASIPLPQATLLPPHSPRAVPGAHAPPPLPPPPPPRCGGPESRSVPP